MNNKKAAQDGKITILYQRLSREDGDKTESESIANQRSLLEEYAKKHGFKPYISVVDDGYSGTNWNCPGWQSIIEMVTDDKVANLLVKDSTRIGRDYLRAGLYREMFRDKGVRLICVSEPISNTKTLSRRCRVLRRGETTSLKYRQFSHFAAQAIMEEHHYTREENFIMKITYTQVGDYLLPDIFLSEKMPFDVFGELLGKYARIINRIVCISKKTLCSHWHIK